MQLLLTSVENSSLQRIEKEQENMTRAVNEIKKLTLNTIPSGVDAPGLTSDNAHDLGEFLSSAFIDEAEKQGSWLSFGLDSWMQTGKWWLLKAQVDLERD